MSDLSRTISDIHYKNPFVVSSSPLTDSVDCIKAAEDNGAGAVSTKLTMLEQPVKGVRRMYAVRGLYSFNPSDRRNDFEVGLELVRKAREAVDIPIWANMAGPGDNYEGWAKLGNALEQAGADVLELNFNCPNFAAPDPNKPDVKIGAAVGKEPNLVSGIVSSVKAAVAIPVYPKLTCDGFDWLPVAVACEKAGADGVTINGGCMAAPPVDIYRGGKPKMATMTTHSFGGFVGPAQRQIGMMRVAMTARNTKLTIAGGGGICTWEDAVESIMYGSTFVTMCTKLLWEGFTWLKKMNEGLLNFMEENGYTKLEDMRGLALQYLTTNNNLQYFNAPARINSDKCTGCDICARIPSCTANLRVENKKAVLNQDTCISCGYCAALCPNGSIYFEA